MQFLRIHRIIGLVVLFSATCLSLISTATAQTGVETVPPTLPCSELEVPSGQKMSFHTYALGVQRYRWNGTGWVFVEPVARLFANDGYREEVGIHFAGPTWESNSGSKVVAARVAGCSADPTAIDWLLLRAVSNEGNGPFRRVAYIQRVNTVGGKAPTAPGLIVGALIDVPYTTEYYFYRAQQ